jgi:hypothetical protein
MRGEFRAAAFQPIMAAGVGEDHPAEAGTAQDAAHALAADLEVFLGVQFFAEMRIVEALILAACQFQDRPAQSRRQSPGHGPSTIAVMHPSHGVGTVALLEPLHLPFTPLQQTGGFAHAQPPGHRILNHFHALEKYPHRAGARGFW